MPKAIVLIALMEFIFTVVILIISFVRFGTFGLICLLPVLLFLDILIIRLIRRQYYRPPENHLGVVYRFGRFHRFIEPDNWTFLLPVVENVHREVSLYMRTAELHLTQVELLDGLTVDVRLKIFFMIDVRLVAPENFLQVMKFEGLEWFEMIKTATEDIVRNRVFLESTYSDLLHQRRNRTIKRRISEELADRVKGFGVIVNKDHGVMPVNIQPNSFYFKAVQDSKAAKPLGEASLERLRPILEALSQIHPEDARTALLLNLASKVVSVDNLPEIILPSLDRHLPAAARKKTSEDDRQAHRPQIKSFDPKYPLAGD